MPILKKPSFPRCDNQPSVAFTVVYYGVTPLRVLARRKERKQAAQQAKLEAQKTETQKAQDPPAKT